MLRECLASAAKVLPADWEIVALVHDQQLIQESRIRLIAIPGAKRSWLRRLHWEWFGFARLSRELPTDFWLSLHDATPRVVAARQAVYCHNPSPFYRVSLREALFEPKFFLFNLFYLCLYRLFIQRNTHVVVQQEWLRHAFLARLGPLPIVVAHPSRDLGKGSRMPTGPDTPAVFLYPALPRAFKNFETLCEAVRILGERGLADRLEIRLTLSGKENRYARWLFDRYGATPGIRFIGRQATNEMAAQYRRATAVVFPSKLETWGLPISEAKQYGLPLLVADLPYAHETVGNYGPVSFFPAESADALAELMQSMLEDRWRPVGQRVAEPAQPFARDWDSLWQLLCDGLEHVPPLEPKLTA